MNDSGKGMRWPGAEAPSGAEIQRRIAAELGLPSRLGYTALLLAGFTSAGISGALLFGEPGLPVRTQVAFSVMMAIGLCWVVFSGWVLTRRRVLFARHRVIAARMAVGFSALFTLGTVALGRWGGTERTWLTAGGMGLIMFAAAIVLLVRARRRLRALTRRREELERQLMEATGSP